MLNDDNANHVLEKGEERKLQVLKLEDIHCKISTLSLNVSGLAIKTDKQMLKISQLLHFARKKEIDVVMVQEAMTKNTNYPKRINLPSTGEWLHITKTKAYRGLSCFYRSYLEDELQLLNNKHDNSMWVKIKEKGKRDYVIGNVYMPDDRKQRSFPWSKNTKNSLKTT